MSTTWANCEFGIGILADRCRGMSALKGGGLGDDAKKGCGLGDDANGLWVGP